MPELSSNAVAKEGCAWKTSVNEQLNEQCNRSVMLPDLLYDKKHAFVLWPVEEFVMRGP